MLLALLPLLLQADAEPPPPPLVTYAVVEKTSAVTPHGERISVLKGTVHASAEKARWSLEGGTLPRTTASVVLAGRDGLTLLDTVDALAAGLSKDELDGLFRGSATGDPGMATFTVRDLAASVTREGKGTSFQGMETVRYRLSLTWTLQTMTTGRISKTRNEVKGVIETLDGWAEARTPFDELSRLFRVRGDVLDTLKPELAKVTGLPVNVSLGATAELYAEPLGGGGAPDEKPLKTTTTITRKLSDLTRRPTAKTDLPLFAVPAGFKTRGLERLLAGPPPLS